MQRILAVFGAVSLLGLLSLGAINAYDRYQISVAAKPLITQAVNMDYPPE